MIDSWMPADKLSCYHGDGPEGRRNLLKKGTVMKSSDQGPSFAYGYDTVTRPLPGDTQDGPTFVCLV